MSRARTALKKMSEWIVIVYDKPGVDRSWCRAEHVANIKPNVEKGIIKSAGPIFSDIPAPLEGKMPFVGSALTLHAESKEEIMEFLKTDVFAKNGIWDLENVLIYPVSIYQLSSMKNNTNNFSTFLVTERPKTLLEQRSYIFYKFIALCNEYLGFTYTSSSQ